MQKRIITYVSLIFLCLVSLLIACNKSDEKVGSEETKNLQTMSGEYSPEDYGQIVAIIESGIPKIIVDKDEMLSQWTENVDVGDVFTRVDIIHLNDIDGDESEGGYFLVAKGSTFTSTYRLQEKITDHGTAFVVMKTTCNSEDCASGGGCQPLKNGYCSPCKYGRCSRSTTGGVAFEHLPYQEGYAMYQYL